MKVSRGERERERSRSSSFTQRTFIPFDSRRPSSPLVFLFLQIDEEEKQEKKHEEKSWRLSFFYDLS